MALKDEERKAAEPGEPAPSQAAASVPPEPARDEPATSGRPAPLWVVPAYVLGLVLVYLGERVFDAMPTGRWVATLLGLAMVAAATAIRFLPKFRVGGERSEIEKLLGALSIAGVVAVALYGATTETGWEKLGLGALEAATQDRVRGVLTVLWIALVALSVIPMLFAEGALLPMRHAERPEARRVRAASVSGFTLVIAAVYGALFVYSADRLDAKVDYSYFKTSRPSDSTRKIAESLSEPIDVVAFFPQVNEIRVEVERYLTELGRGVPNLRIEVQDRLLIPKRAKELKATQDGVIVLAKGTVTETLNVGVDDRNARPKLKTLDRDFQERLLKLVRSRRIAYLTVGHGELNEGTAGADSERGVRIARTLLQKQNYVVKDLGLGQGLANDVPQDADIVLVLGPTEPFAPEEVAALERFASRAGRLLIAVDPDALGAAEPGPEGQPETTSVGSDAPVAGSGKPAASSAPSGKAAPSAAPKPKPAPSAAAKPGPSAAAKPAPSGIPKPGPSASAGQPPDPKKPGDAAASASAPTPAPADGGPRGLAALARVVGLDFSRVLLANEKQHVRRRFNDSDRTLLVTNRFSSHAAVSTLSRNSARAGIVVFGSGSLERASGATEKVDFAVKAMTGTFADANRNYRADKDEKPGNFNLAAAVTKPRSAGEPKKPPGDGKSDKKDEKKDDKKKKDKDDADEMRAFVLADADALTDIVMANVVGNQVLFMDAVRWLGGEESFAGEVNTEEDIRIEHTKQKDQIWFYATIFGAPALVLGLGLVFARRSRKRGGGS